MVNLETTLYTCHRFILKVVYIVFRVIRKILSELVQILNKET